MTPAVAPKKLLSTREHIWWPHLVVGLLEIGTAVMTQTRPSHSLPGHAERVPSPR